MDDKILAICFYGASDTTIAEEYKKEVEKLIEKLSTLKAKRIKFITGGYGGIMDLIAKTAKEHDKFKDCEIIGITSNAYDFENPNNDGYKSSNDISKYNQIVIQANGFTDRIQAMIELSDLFIVLPGKQGSLGELLLTYETYDHSKNTLNNKQAKLLVHSYWKDLLSHKKYFRDFHSNIFEYFDMEDNVGALNTCIKTFNDCAGNTSNQLSEDTSTDADPPSDFIGLNLKKLQKNINKTILGRYYEFLQKKDKTTSQEQWHPYSPILGLDFGWVLNNVNRTENKDGGFYTYSTKDYSEHTKVFLQEYNSIMFGISNVEYKVAKLNGKLESSSSKQQLKFSSTNKIPKKENNRKDGNFETLKNFFQSKEYGQLLIWRAFKVTPRYTKNANDPTDEITLAIFILLNYNIPQQKLKDIRQHVDDFLLVVSSAKAGELFGEKEKEIIHTANRAAISQVMARNTSHNIGAHVMNKLTGNLRELDLLLFKKENCNYQFDIGLKELHETTIQNLEKKDWYKISGDHVKQGMLKNEILLDQISLFNNYVKCRMDYLADISFGIPLMQTNKYAYSELFKEFDKVRLLLEHISGLSDFKFKIEFRRNGDLMNDENDLLVAIPNDILGMQAFYNIIENVIRNTAKHALNKPELTVFTVNFIDEWSEQLVGHLPNDEEKTARTTEIKNVLKDCIAVEVYDNVSVRSIVDLVQNQNDKINEDILIDNQLRSGSLGVIEMEASAAYLRKRDVGFINHEHYEIHTEDESWSRKSKKAEDNPNLRGTNCRHFLKAFAKKDTFAKDTFYLGYRFFLLRPETILVVTKQEVANKDELKKQGISVVTPQEFTDHLNAGKVYNHEFVVYDNDSRKSEIDEYKTSLPIRILKVKKEDLASLFKKVENDSEGNQQKNIIDIWEDFCWKEWNRNKYDILVMNSYNAEESTAQAVFLDHLYSNSSTEPLETWKQNLGGMHLEALSSLAQQKMPDFNRLTKDDADNKETTEKFKQYLTQLDYTNRCTHYASYCKLAESIRSRVIVIDERIQEAAERKEFMGILYKNIYEKMNVVVPDKIKMNLSEKSFDKIKEDLKDYIRKSVANTTDNDFILIHYSILERLYNNKDINSKLYEELIGESKINIVITSGRGTPENLSNRMRFVNLSAVITAFVDIRSKYAISYLLNSTRKANKI